MNYESLQSIAYLILAIYMIIAMKKKCNTKTIIVSVLTIMVSITIFARVFWIIDKIELIKERGIIESLKYILWLRISKF